MEINLWFQERVEEAAWKIARRRAAESYPSRYDEGWRPSEYRPTFRFMVNGNLLEVSLGDALRELMKKNEDANEASD